MCGGTKITRSQGERLLGVMVAIQVFVSIQKNLPKSAQYLPRDIDLSIVDADA